VSCWGRRSDIFYALVGWKEVKYIVTRKKILYNLIVPNGPVGEKKNKSAGGLATIYISYFGKDVKRCSRPLLCMDWTIIFIENNAIKKNVSEYRIKI